MLSCQNYLDKDNLIHNIYFGDQTGTSVKKVSQQLNKLSQKLKMQAKPVLILTDVTALGEVNLAARKEGIKIMQNLDYEKAAIYGCNFVTGSLVKLMIITSGRGFKVQVFDNKKDATKWLKS